MESKPENTSSQPPVSTSKEKSAIEFAYTDLESAEEVAKGVHSVGGTACNADQLAAELGMEAKGGGFRSRIAGAQTFGLVSYERGGRIALTDLGLQLVDPALERTARMNAFLHVPLYQKVYDEFKGGPLPPAPAIERAIVTMGVLDSTKVKARQVMMKSAKYAGFMEHAADRLIKPSIKGQPAADRRDDEVKKKPPGGGGDGEGGGGSEHPLIRGLLLTLPHHGEPWAVGDRLNWLRMADSIFKMIYKREPTEGEITFKIVNDGA